MQSGIRIRFLLLISAYITGCAAPRSGPDASPAPRPSELDLLDAWVGEWDSTSQMKPAGVDKTIVCSGHESIRWTCDKRFLVEESSWDTGGPEGRESAMAVRTWDPHARLFRSWYYDSHGMIGHSKMTYDAANKTWRVQTRNADPVTCEPTIGEMTILQTDDNTMEWHFTEWNGAKTKKRIEMDGVSRKK